MKRIIFLDIDGVLNHTGTPEFGDLQQKLKTLWIMQTVNIEQLNWLVEKADAHIVVSSSWRHHFQPIMHELKAIMVEFGFKFPERVIDTTPRRLNDEKVIQLATRGVGLKMSMSIPRGWEIFEWLEHNKDLVESFVVLDDDSPLGGLRERPKALRPIMQRFVHTDTRKGLTATEAVAALKHLQTPLA